MFEKLDSILRLFTWCAFALGILIGFLLFGGCSACDDWSDSEWASLSGHGYAPVAGHAWRVRLWSERTRFGQAGRYRTEIWRTHPDSAHGAYLYAGNTWFYPYAGDASVSGESHTHLEMLETYQSTILHEVINGLDAQIGRIEAVYAELGVTPCYHSKSGKSARWYPHPPVQYRGRPVKYRDVGSRVRFCPNGAGWCNRQQVRFELEYP